MNSTAPFFTKMVALVTFSLLHFLPCDVLAQLQPADSLATPGTVSLLRYISSLASLPDKKVLSGQWMNFRGFPESPASEFDTSIVSIYRQTSKWVSIIGTEYMREFTTPKYSKAIKSLAPVNQELINYAKQNGIVTVMSTFKNPWTNGNQYDMTGSTNLLDIVTSGTAANIAFKKELDSIAYGFQQLQDSGVTVLYRPFHEMNGAWFWWGSKSPTLPTNADFTALWKFVYTYMTTTKKLHNILWCYTPSARDKSISNSIFKTELFYYPGSSYVDIIGLDIYADTLDIPNYDAIVATGKPIGIAEFGPKNTTVTNLQFVYDYTRLISQIKSKYPAICYWISYNHFKAGNTTNWVFNSLSTQKNTDKLLNDPWVANRGDRVPQVTYSTKSYGTLCRDAAPVLLSGGMPSGGVYSGRGVTPDGKFHPNLAGAGTWNITYSYTENGISASATDSIVVRELPSVHFTFATNTTMCLNSPPLSLSGGTPIGGMYSGIGVKNGQFDPSISGEGSFTVRYDYTDGNGCSGSDSARMNVHSTSSISLNKSAIDSFILNGVTYTKSGSYTQVLQNADGCDSTITLSLTITTTSVEEERISPNAMALVPNPSLDGTFNIRMPKQDAYPVPDILEMYNTLGVKVFSASLADAPANITTNLPHGIYLYRLLSRNTLIFAGNVIVL